MRKTMFLLLLLLFPFVSCDNVEESAIPNVSFRFETSLAQSPYYRLNTLGDFFYVAKNAHNYPIGYSGIIIGQALYDPGTYCAYDAACPIEALQSVRLDVVEDKELGEKVAKCSKCGNRFWLNNRAGTGIDVKAKMREYNIIVSNGKVIVSN